MCDLGDRIDIGNVTVGVAEGLQIDGTSIFLDRTFDFGQVVGIDKSSLNSVLGKGMGEQIEAATVDGLLCDDVSTVGCQGFDRVGDGSGSGSQG